MSEKLTQKWAVASFFDELPDGFEFHKSEVPLHATLAGVFAIDLAGASIAELLEACAQAFSPFVIHGESEEQWGDIQVITIQDSEKFTTLYSAVQDLLLQNQAVFNEPHYLKAGFRPHVTVQRHTRLEHGEEKLISSLSLVDMFPGSDGNRRQIHSTITLGDDHA